MHNYRGAPLVTSRAGAYTDAKVAQEQQRARLIGHQADVESAKARHIEATTLVLLSDLARKNDEALADRRSQEQELRVEQAREEVLHTLERLLLDAEKTGMQISFEDLGKVTKQLSAGPDEGTNSE